MLGPELDIALLAVGSALFVAHRRRRRGAGPATVDHVHGTGPAAPGSARTLQVGADPALRRIAPDAIDRLADRLSHDRVRAAARSSAARQLAGLDPAEWLIERDVVIAGVPVAFVVFGPTGVFLLAPGQGWTPTSLQRLDAAACHLANDLPGYPDPARSVAVVPTGSPTSWFDDDGRGGWVVGEAWLLHWLIGFRDQGFARGDITRLRDMLAAVDPSAPQSLTIPDALG